VQTLNLACNEKERLPFLENRSSNPRRLAGRWPVERGDATQVLQLPTRRGYSVARVTIRCRLARLL